MPIILPTGKDSEEYIVDTAADARPGQIDFSGPSDEDSLDPEAYADEPWSDVDPEAAEDGLTPFDPSQVLADTSSYERWLQSALKLLVAPDLVVDGKPGARTKAAVERFQKASPRLGGPTLRADGIAGPKTVAALEQLTDSTAPTRREGDKPVAQPEPNTEPEPEPNTEPPAQATTNTLSVREVVDADGVTEYVITAGDQEVRFSYWTEDYRNYKPYNVSRYRGARKGLLKDDDYLGIGYSRSELKILKANALKESGGAFGAINTWDDQIVSWGMAQFAGQAGTLAALLSDLKDNPRTRPAFDRWFAANGIDVASGKYPWKNGQTKTGWHVVVTKPDGEVARGNPGWQYIRTQPKLIGAFLLAGNDPDIQLGQCIFWRDGFLRRAISKRIAKRADGSAGDPARQYVTSERGLAVLVRLHNWMPGYVVTWSNKFIAELEAAHKDRDLDLSDRGQWTQTLEDSFVQKICDERKRVKSGSYDTYALDLSRTRGSFA
ncbi:MAG: peptidoglycan-binding protein [Myxococcales bacterium]|nr:peptidoglycan-binding protein [Myxococcales bacterium]